MMDGVLTVGVEDDGIVIRLPWPSLKTATKHCPRLEVFDEDSNRTVAPTVVDLNVWAREVVSALNEEGEGGDTMVTLLFDKAFEHAAEQGAEGIRCHGEDD